MCVYTYTYVQCTLHTCVDLGEEDLLAVLLLVGAPLGGRQHCGHQIYLNKIGKVKS